MFARIGPLQAVAYSEPMPRVVITEFMDPASAGTLVDDFDAVFDPDLADQRERLIRLIADAEALVVRNRTSVDAELLDASPGLRLVARLGVGLDNIDVAAASERGVEVAPALGANAVAVAEYVMGSILSLRRGVFGATDEVIAGRWPRNEMRGQELAGTTLGLIGLGVIAREVARRARAFEMRVIAHDPYLDAGDEAWDLAEPVGLENVLKTSDAISIHVPLTPDTEGLIDASNIQEMKPSVLIVNTSRGGVVDEKALVDALHEGHIGGAALDVFESEPLDADRGEVFAGTPNLLLTPHIAGVTEESEKRIGAMTVAAVRRTLASP